MANWNDYKCVCVDGNNISALEIQKNKWERVVDFDLNNMPGHFRKISTMSGKQYYLNTKKGFTLQFSKANEKTKLSWDDGKTFIDFQEHDAPFTELVKMIGTVSE